MKKRIHKITILILSCILLGCSLVREEVSYKIDCQNLLSKEVEIQLPMPFHLQKENYEEGVIYFYSFIDSAYIIIFQGSMMEFPMDKYQSIKTKKGKKKQTYIGINDNSYWRKDIYTDGIRVYYGNVRERNKGAYDKVLNKIKIKSRKR